MPLKPPDTQTFRVKKTITSLKRGLTRSAIPLGREGLLLRLTLAQVVVVAPVAANDALAELCRLNVMAREKKRKFLERIYSQYRKSPRPEKGHNRKN